MEIEHFVSNSWEEYVAQVREMDDGERGEIAADFEDSGMADAMALTQVSGGFSAEDAKSIFNSCMSELTVEQKREFVMKLKEKYWEALDE